MMLRLLLGLLLVLAPIGAAAKSGGPPAQPMPWTFWGTQPDQPQSAWPAAPQATARLWNCNGETTLWSSVETASGVYNWSALDACVAVMRAKGVALIYTFGGVPGWANGNASRDVPPTGTSAISAFASAVATRYRGRIQYYECWNEINEIGDWWSGSNAQTLALCQAIQAAVAAADPAAILLTPSTTGESGPTVMQAYLAGGGGAYASVLNIHTYAISTSPSAPPEQTAQICQNYRALAAEYGLAGYPLFSDEGGWGDGTSVNTANLQEAYGAIYPILLGGCGLDRMLWYQYDGDWGQQWTGSALTPGGQAFFTTQALLNGATWLRPPARVAGVNGVRNPAASGAVPGAPGTLPTDWSSYLPDATHGVATTILGTGVEAGIPYLDLQVAGTATAGAAGTVQINFDTIAAALGQQWTPCFYLRLVGGSLGNVALGLAFQEYDAAQNYLGSDANLDVYPIGAALDLDQICFAGTTSHAGVAFVSPLIEFSYAVGQPIDITVRLGAPSMDTGSVWSGIFTKAGGYQGDVLWDAAGGPTSVAAPSWCSFVTNYAGTKAPVTGALSLTNVPVFCSNQ